jgi:hypothetical protein
MKNTICTLLILISGTCFAQDKYASYENAFENKTFNIQIGRKDGNNYKLFIEVGSVDDLSGKGGIVISNTQHAPLVSAIQAAKEKYVEWKNVAIENNVEDLDKRIEQRANVGTYFMYGIDWQFQFSVDLTFVVKFTEGKHYMMIKTGNLVSSSNRYMAHKGFLLVFSSEQEIDTFLELLSLEKMTEYLNAPSNKDLFKN